MRQATIPVSDTPYLAMMQPHMHSEMAYQCLRANSEPLRLLSASQSVNLLSRSENMLQVTLAGRVQQTQQSRGKLPGCVAAYSSGACASHCRLCPRPRPSSRYQWAVTAIRYLECEEVQSFQHLLLHLSADTASFIASLSSWQW